MSATESEISAELAKPEPSAGFWKPGMMILAGISAGLWLITMAWQGVDLDGMLSRSLKTEGDMWLFALTWAPLYFMVKGIAASWGITLGIPNCLMLGHLVLHRIQPKRRWWLVSVATAAIFIGLPIAFNRQEEQRLANYYQGSDSATLPNVAGRAVELPNKRPLSSNSENYVTCPKMCLDFLAFGNAHSVSISFPGKEKEPQSGPVARTFRLGPSGRDCRGSTLKNICPQLVTEAMPDDRLILTLGPVTTMSGEAKTSFARRIYVKDMRHAERPPATLTRFHYAKFSVLLNIAWGDEGFNLVRGGLPLLGGDSLDSQLYRAAAPSKVLGKSYYPFR